AEVKFDEMAFADSSFDAEIARLRNFQNSNPDFYKSYLTAIEGGKKLKDATVAQNLEESFNQIASEFSRMPFTPEFWIGMGVGMGVGAFTTTISTQALANLKRLHKVGKLTAGAVGNAMVICSAMAAIQGSAPLGAIGLYYYFTGNEEGLNQTLTPMGFTNAIASSAMGMGFNMLRIGGCGCILARKTVGSFAVSSGLFVGETVADISLGLATYYIQQGDFKGCAQFLRSNVASLMSNRVIFYGLSKVKFDAFGNKKLPVGHKDVVELNKLEDQFNHAMDDYDKACRKNTSNDEKTILLTKAAKIKHHLQVKLEAVNEDLLIRKLVDNSDIIVNDYKLKFSVSKEEFDGIIKLKIEEANKISDTETIARLNRGKENGGFYDRRTGERYINKDFSKDEKVIKRLELHEDAHAYCDILGPKALKDIITKIASNKYAKYKWSDVIDAYKNKYDYMKDYSDIEILHEAIADYNSQKHAHKQEPPLNIVNNILNASDPISNKSISQEYGLDLTIVSGKKGKRSKIHTNKKNKPLSMADDDETKVLPQELFLSNAQLIKKLKLAELLHDDAIVVFLLDYKKNIEDAVSNGHADYSVRNAKLLHKIQSAQFAEGRRLTLAEYQKIVEQIDDPKANRSARKIKASLLDDPAYVLGELQRKALLGPPAVAKKIKTYLLILSGNLASSDITIHKNIKSCSQLHKIFEAAITKKRAYLTIDELEAIFERGETIEQTLKLKTPTADDQLAGDFLVTVNGKQNTISKKQLLAVETHRAYQKIDDFLLSFAVRQTKQEQRYIVVNDQIIKCPRWLTSITLLDDILLSTYENNHGRPISTDDLLVILQTDIDNTAPPTIAVIKK
ncbi:MAG: hypothetical protein JW841_06445, partial [Deltaproteobacteria bacterium]|nr:hypothetical protein [Deltaproteobacteria bacterium]